jgi:hypothetical protein
MRARSFLILGGMAVVTACSAGSPAGTLVGQYNVTGVLVENTCGQTALPTANPLSFAVEIREANGVGYWVPAKSSQNMGSVREDGTFSFTLSQSSVVNQTSAGDNLQPSDFVGAQPDFDLQKRSCVVTTQQSVTGTLHRRVAADGGVAYAALSDGGSDDDLTGENTIMVTPAPGSDCTTALAALGGAWLALPCDARYELSGKLSGVSNVAGNGN